MTIFDVLIVGGGPGGYLAGERAAQAGLSACVIEERALGGVCLNEGCIPTKTLLNSAKIYDSAKNGGRFGVTAGEVAIDHSKVVDRKNMVVKQLVSGVAAKLKGHDVTVIEARGEIAARQDNAFAVRAGEQTVLGKNLILATGSEAAVPPIPGVREGLDSGFVVTNRELLDVRQPPAHLCVIGGGVIGLEMAAYFAAIGCKVIVLEMLTKLAGELDDDITAILQKNLAKKGITFKLGCKVTGVGDGGVSYEENGTAAELACDTVLLSIGRRPRSAGIGLEVLGIETDRGAILVDAQQRTNVPGVYAIGDVTAKLMLAHVAYRQAEVAVATIAGKPDAMDYSAVPSVLYTSPEAAACGETLKSAQAKGMDAREVSISLRYSGRYLAEVAGGDGICKLVFEGERLIGVHMIGSYVSEIIWGAAVLIGQRMTVEEIGKVIFPHPSVCEVIKEALYE